MAKNRAEAIICVILLVSIGLLYLVNKWLSTSEVIQNCKAEYCWLIFALRNVVGYSTVFLPGYLIYRYIRKINYLDKIGGNNYLSIVIRKCFGEEDIIDRTNAATNTQQPRTLFNDILLLLFYFVGLQGSFLTWGVLQEKIMTRNYTNAQKNTGNFTDSQFLVFVNKIIAFCMSGIVILCTRQPRHKAPLYKYIFCSFSNIVSSWCQYEALKYVSFLHQVLAKAAKTIPVMVMGKVVSRTKYEYYEYVSAMILSIGMLLFMLGTNNDHKGSSVTTFSGIILLCSYIVFDSFTSNWQGVLFKQFGMSPIQMMCAVNLFSCIFTAVSLLQQGGFVTSVNFMFEFPTFIFDCLLLSFCSAVGQLFIFKTIASFGPLVFAIITTIRQGFSVLLSCLIYNHHIYSLGIFGFFLVFFSVLLRIYCGYWGRVNRKRVLQNATNLKL